MRKLIALGLACALGLGGQASFQLILDFYPNPNHVPLYVAQELGFFREEGVEVELLVPSDPSAPAKLVAARAVEMGLTPQMNLLIAVDEGLPLVAVAALIDGALGGLLSLREYGVERLEDLRGKRIGYSLEPLEPVLWRTMLATVGVGPEEFALVYTGMATVPALLTRAVEAIGAFRNYELLAVELLGHSPVFFPQEDYGVPNTYELLFVVHPALLEERPEAVRAVLRAVARGVAFTRQNPDQAFRLFLRVFPELEDELNRRSFAVTLPLYAENLRHDDGPRWAAMVAFLHSTGMIRKPLPLEQLYTTAVLP
ncbi:MAG: ABC transporter substrate-binding protein [Candidatus Bipolaricaulota bacterium]|nr:ABC transporter substrate-binding protein [Candidatus Bipolaricaulota bacterium]MCX7844348.1 ABC transporter substrate-binding protein [Candidatus Bipolaricaulota bacterium]MDW8152483.1 ABC transporter substrate-binding protein [Candidatus Bipolaricaulota bacterium]